MSRLYLAAPAASLVLLACVLVSCGSEDRRPAASCTPVCSGFQMCCTTGTGGTACANTGVDPMNCGMCGSRCAAGETCRSGVCMRGTTDSGVVVRPDGMVPMVDAGGGGGMCSPTCSSSQRCCGTSCVNRSVAPGTDGRTDSSFMNCVGCGIACNAMTASACTTAVGMTTGMPSCRCGNFPSCTAPSVCAIGAAGAYQCVNTMSDPSNCGMVGRRCASGESCSMGMCICPGAGAACPMGQGCCGGRCVDTSGDTMNCGMCGRVCPASTTCSMGECRCGTDVCDPPAGMGLGELCCSGACVPQDNSNCGACGMMCDVSGGMMCINGMGIMGGSSVCCGISLPGFPGFCFGFPTPPP